MPDQTPDILAQVLTTSNITGAIDLAFVDRADIKAFIGPPSVAARYEMLRGCVAELARVGIVAAPPLLPWRRLQVWRQARDNVSMTCLLRVVSACGHLALSCPGPASRHCSADSMVTSRAIPVAVECSMQSEEHSLLDSSASAAAEHAALVDGSRALARVARLCEGLSGRAIRKLPFLAHTQLGTSPAAAKQGCPLGKFLAALHRAAQLEVSDRERMASRDAP